jgi:hypothetical protein
MKKMIAVDEDGATYIDVDKITKLEWRGDNETYVTLDDDSGLVFDWNIDVLANKLSGGKALTPPGFVFDEDDEDINDEDPGAITW